MSELWLVRHGETAWSASRRHTGRTDLELTPNGEKQADLLRKELNGRAFSLVLTSPLRRARETCQRAGYGDQAVVDADLCEWDYGIYEGRTTADIRAEQPGWTVWTGGVPGGETVEAVGARTDRVILRASAAKGDVVLFAHAHVLRILIARWLGLAPDLGRAFIIDTASVSVLAHEHEERVLRLLNKPG